ncbi:MAG: polyribonucleotide nucleotidyltransferase [Armatimonadota bacterium]|nr:polyribonucleotide nucleotidyltransferase [bacterium]
MTITTVETELGGKTLTLEQGRVAGQANGAVLLRCGETVVLATATMSAKPREGMNFFPLICDYEERKYAVGKIPGGFVKRGGRPSEKAILTSRLIDRPTRPLFSEGMRNDVQVIAMPLSMEPDVPADMMAVNAASAALAISDIPWGGPFGFVRVCRVNGEFVINPSLEQIKESDMELLVAGKDGKVLEIELEAGEVTEDELMVAMDLAHDAIDTLVAWQMDLVAKVGKPKAEVPVIAPDPALLEEIAAKISPEIQEFIKNPDNSGREKAIFDLEAQLKKRLIEEYPERESEIGDIVYKIIKKQVRKMIVEENARPDGRALDQIRPLRAEVGLLPRVHGSALFSRGQTQVLTTLTLGSLDDAQMVDNLEEDGEKRFMHFYNFPPYSVGEVSPLRGAGRREVGHGALAEKALRPMIPAQNDFPYAMLMTSDVLESNGSTSMASTCGCTLALLDAGVQLKEPVAGISIGLVTGEDKKVLLTDIQGLEDFHGDMDFKVAGTRNGITAIQVDTKTNGLDRDVVKGALEQAKAARMKILEVIADAIPGAREKMSPYAPRVYVVVIHPDKIGDIIGPGGKVIKKIEAETGAKLDIEQDGHVYITSVDAAGGERAKKIVEDITKEVSVGEVYTGKVTRIEPFGAFVEILPGRDGLVHISQLAKERVNRTEDVCNLGDELLVRVLEIGDDGKIRLTRRGLIEGDEDYVAPPPESRGGGPRGGGPRGGGRPHGGGGGGGYRDRGPRPDSSDDGPRAQFRPKR